MTNKQIAGIFNDLAGIMELHDENAFKIRSYQNAYIQLRKFPKPLDEASREELESIKGVGKAIADKIQEILESGTLQTYQRYLDTTPAGIIEMLRIKGVGPKKIRSLWKDLGIETIGELKYACIENRLVELKGFGEKTQRDLLQKLEFFQSNKGFYHFAALEAPGDALLQQLKELYPGELVSFCGPFRRKCITLSSIDFLVSGQYHNSDAYEEIGLESVELINDKVSAFTQQGIKISISHVLKASFGTELIRFTGSEQFVDGIFGDSDSAHFQEEDSYFKSNDRPFVVPELREGIEFLTGTPDFLIEESDIKGVVHSHTVYSDGLQSVEEMALEAKNRGYSYIAITDHSKSAFYANGLTPDRVVTQFREIEELNKKIGDFIIFKGIESDILNDGSLDYDEELLAQFDLVIASVHSNLKMDLEKATNRLIKAIENPYTTMLGHPTGRLLLSREGYPIDHHKVIDACSENGVAIEVNANPYRLDIDWKWLPYAMKKGVKISINPDAHSTRGFDDIHFGVLAARKGGLTREFCLNALDANHFGEYIAAKQGR